MFKLDLVTPEQKLVLGQELQEIVLPAYRGELNILPGHAPLMTTLSPGVLTYKLKSGETRSFAISWGYCQVSFSGVTVLAEEAISKEQVDVKKAQDELKTLESRLGSDALDDQDWEKIQREIGRLQAEVRLAGSAR